MTKGDEGHPMRVMTCNGCSNPSSHSPIALSSTFSSLPQTKQSSVTFTQPSIMPKEAKQARRAALKDEISKEAIRFAKRFDGHRRHTERKERILASKKAKKVKKARRDEIDALCIAMNTEDYLAAKDADVLTDEMRLNLAAAVTPSRATQRLAVTDPSEMGLPSSLKFGAIRALSRWRPGAAWTYGFNTGLAAIHYTGSKSLATKIAETIQPLAPHLATMTTASGRVSRRVDPSTLLENMEFVKGSGCVGREGMDSTESKKTKESRGSSGHEDPFEEDYGDEAYDDEFLGHRKGRRLPGLRLR